MIWLLVGLLVVEVAQRDGRSRELLKICKDP